MSVDLLRYMGLPFVEGGRGPASFDCAGLLADIYRQRGIELPAWPCPADDAGKRGAIADGVRDWLRLDAPQPWCGVALRVDSPRFVSHVGCVLPDCLRFIHTTAESGVTVERLDSPRWAGRIAGYYAWPN